MLGPVGMVVHPVRMLAESRPYKQIAFRAIAGLMPIAQAVVRPAASRSGSF
jgi:hypothetical protein